MSLITSITTPTMSSQQIAELTDKRHDNVKRTIEDLAQRGLVHPQSEDEWSTDKLDRPRATRIYRVGKRDSFVVVAQLSPEFTVALVDRWQELEAKVTRPMTQAELIAASANHLVDIERRQAAQHAALASVEARTNQLEQIRYLDSVPSGFESITTIRDRINKRLGLPAWVINAVMREVTGAPLPFAMVRSKHAEDGGQPFAIWPKPAITRRFDRFIEECTLVTAERATHPEITGGRFKVKPL